MNRIYSLHFYRNIYNILAGRHNFSQQCHEISQAKVFEEKEYFQIDQFSFRNLTARHQARALQILSHEFYHQEPLTTAYSKKYPHNQTSIFQWNQLFSFFMDDAVANNLSVVVLDRENNDKVAGVFICRDICFVPQPFIDSFFGIKEYPQTLVLELEGQLRKQLHPELDKFLNEKGRTVDFWGVAIDQKYGGKKVIFKNMFSLMEKLAKEAGYTHAYMYAVNGKTSLVAKKSNLELIAEIDATKVVLRNKQPFTEVEQLHRNPSLWLKKLQ